MKLQPTIFACMLGILVVGPIVAQQEGDSIGKVITVGEDRVVLAVHDKGQMTFEVRTVQDGDQRVADRAQLAQIKTLKTDQMVHVKWVQAHDGHYYIQEMFVGPADGAQHGLVTGTVITADEGRVVIASDDGGQVTLEPMWVRRQDKHIRDPFQELAGTSLQAGDKVVAMWQLGEGTHFMTRGVAKLDPEGQAVASVLLQAQLREAYNQVNQLQNDINQLRNLIDKLLEQKAHGEGE